MRHVVDGKTRPEVDSLYLPPVRKKQLTLAVWPALLTCLLPLLGCETQPADEQTRLTRAASPIKLSESPAAGPEPEAPQEPEHPQLKSEGRAERSPGEASRSDALGGANTPPTEALTEAELTPPPSDVPRVYALSRYVWVRAVPQGDVQWIGYLWMGGSVPIRGSSRVPGAGCAGEWTPIEPRGWVCVDNQRATTDPDSPMLRLLYPYRPRVETPFPHHYAAVHAPLTRYAALPSREVQKARERGFTQHFEKVLAARSSKNITFPDHLGKVTVSLSGREPPPFHLLRSGLPDLPPGLSEGRINMVGRSAFAYAGRADSDDRTFLLASDMSWVPQDRVELLEPSEFQGVPLGDKYRLPLAAFRGKDRPAYRIDADGSLVVLHGHFKRLSFVNLSGETRSIDDRTFHRVQDSELWLDEKEAVLPTPQEKTPWGAPLTPTDKPTSSAAASAPEGRATWVEASILGGWLLAFEGTRPVYATLISAGRGGPPQQGRSALSTASTPTGRFRFTGKFKTATMESSSSPILHADVPWTQNFSGPHAVHSAYWHDDWGNLKSAGCVNLSPRDGKWLFEFSEPEVPPGWHGVRYVSRYGSATPFIVHD